MVPDDHQRFPTLVTTLPFLALRKVYPYHLAMEKRGRREKPGKFTQYHVYTRFPSSRHGLSNLLPGRPQSQGRMGVHPIGPQSAEPDSTGREERLELSLPCTSGVQHASKNCTVPHAKRMFREKSAC